MATSIDDNAADEKSDKPIWRLLNIHCTRVQRSESRAGLHAKAFELGTRQTGRRSDLRSKSADSECLLNCVSCFAAEQFIGIIRSFKG
ncbi:hypothetical protein, partial [Blautia sp. OF03-15BH]|uniref:hypothetical protein n=1 Tax=Blautia sp. OF03-15BH TaxID=2292287 RepID=UPI001A9A41C3